MEEEVKSSLALDVLVNNEKVNVIQLSGKLSLPLPSCSQKLEEWIKAWSEKISREYLVEGLDVNGNGYVRIVSEQNYKKLDKKNTTSFLFSIEKERQGVITSSYRPSNSIYKRIRLTPQLRDVVQVVAPESAKELKEIKVEKRDAPQAKKPTPSTSRETLVSKFFSEKPKEKPKESKEEPQKLEKSPEIKKETKLDSGNDREAKTSPAKAKVPPKAAEKKTDGKFKGKAAPVGNKMITSFFTKVSKPITAPPVKAEVVPKIPEKVDTVEKTTEVAKKRPLSEVKSPEQKKSSPKPQKKMKMTKKAKPKVKAGTSRILQIVDEDTSSEEEKVDRESDEEQKEENVVLENEEKSQEKTPPRPYRKKKTIRECYKDEDGYDNFILKEVDCSSEGSEEE